MRRPSCALSAVLTAGALVSSCALAASPGEPWTQERPITEVTTVVLATSGELTILTDGPPRLEITAGEHVIDQLTSTVKGERLFLGLAGNPPRLGEVHYELTLPTTTAVAVTGSGNAHLHGATGTNLSMAVTGSGSLRATDVAIQRLEGELAGSGHIDIAGSTSRQQVTVTGSGTYHALDLP